MSAGPALSVVVASFRGPELLAQCLDSLRPQCRRLDTELIVARAEREPAGRLGEIAMGCRVVSAPATADIPRLRGLGLAEARGEWVALTEDHCVADPGWLDALREAVEPGVQVLGGSMGNAKPVRATDWGAFFSEYGFFAARSRGPGERAAPLITGANVAYHRSVASKVAAWALEGSWENVIHDRLYEQGYRFGLVPAARIRQNLSYRLVAFCRDRFEHGRDYAATRARPLTVWRRAALVAASPLLPLLLAARVARSVDADARRHFPRALPATLAFLSAWAAGEALGYARGAAR